MKKYLIKVFSILFIFIFVSPVFARSLKDRTVYVSVENIQAKKNPSFWSSGTDSFSYGDAVSVVDEKDSWVMVENKNDGRKGWLKESTVTVRKINPKRKSHFDADEIALAGKGFSSPLESEYSKQYDLDFDVIDEIEAEEVDQKQLMIFIVEGHLNVADLIGDEYLQGVGFDEKSEEDSAI